MAVDRLMEERIARNDATFREANERIGAAAEAYDVAITVPFICECADPTCREIVRMTLDEYEDVRKSSRTFMNVPGHHVAARGTAEVVDRRDTYVIVEKLGHAGEVAEALDERRKTEQGRRASGEE